MRRERHQQAKLHASEFYDVRPSETPLDSLLAMGFSQAQAMKALAVTNNNLEKATIMLLSEEDSTQDNKNETNNNAPVASTEPELPSEMICVICWENTRNAIFLPCGHVCTCWDCASSVQKSGQCPICRVDIQSIWKVYYS